MEDDGSRGLLNYVSVYRVLWYKASGCEVWARSGSIGVVVTNSNGIKLALARGLTTTKRSLALVSSGRHILSSDIRHCSIVKMRKGYTSVHILRDTSIGGTSLLVTTADSSRIGLLYNVATRNLGPEVRAVTEVHGPRCNGRVFAVQSICSLSLVIGPRGRTTHRVRQLVHCPNFLRERAFTGDHIRVIRLQVRGKDGLYSITLVGLRGIIGYGILIYTIDHKKIIRVPSKRFVLQRKSRLFVATATRVLARLLHGLNVVARGTGHMVVYNNKEVNCCLSA